MKINLAITTFILLLFTSCALVPSIYNTSYLVDSSTSNLKINTKKGKWLLCEANISPSIHKQVVSETKNLLTSKLDERLLFHTESNIIIPNPLSFDVNEEILTDIKNGNDFDYLIVLDVDIKKNDFSNYSLIPATDRNAQKKVISRVNIYDLNTKKLIYNKQVQGIISAKNNPNEDTSRPVYTKNIDKLNLKTFRKFLKILSNDLETLN
ncbi:hypothetical protein SAMN05443634_102210 [Chishuiella changwenlii]|uniref:Uncharacterized protein n=1 Tax=Chishuiella changwenlii TaxID=1434701 RepID=A0A1M6U537_9FLAO|nr:hypothetical protein [Chishuiella changwenlii]GGE99958.1 hypothetical protein GCM10010984_16940 [Chishuiella changwenlii]SHK64208.1 hypothetical protein SAMN05443634_102210 [Chishuiella changwenlii]